MPTTIVQNGDVVGNVPMEIMPSDVTPNQVIPVIRNNLRANVDAPVVDSRDKDLNSVGYSIEHSGAEDKREKESTWSSV
ncbi:hypothetical protein V6N13_022965 [Hibiscus sabdariffa]|uniref:Uncharacterized protein n=2 Tax=Hibiscus sabdariffa TaxID=183260 RepID=A0ABR2AI66_9ROSI